MERPRKILHVDMDAFYASVEQRDDPSLRGRPVVVGGPPNSRGVVATASYEARRYGVRSAMPSSQAGRLCPHAVFVPPRFDVYRGVSRQIRALFTQVTDLVEPLSLDEAYLDVTHNHLDEPSATRLAQWLRRRILEETGLTASAGVAPNKFLAKLASDMDKPDGLTVISPGRVQEVLEGLPVQRIHGVGPATAARMQSLGIHTVCDLRRVGEAALGQLFGKAGRWYWDLAHGRDERPVETEHVRRSLGAERTFAQDLRALPEMRRHLTDIAEEVTRRASAASFPGRTVTLKLTYKGFERITRSQTRPRPPRDAGEILATALDLLAQTEAPGRPVRLLGITLSNPGEAQGWAEQLILPFPEARAA